MLEELQWSDMKERRQQAYLSLSSKIHSNLATVNKKRCLSEAGGVGVGVEGWRGWCEAGEPGLIPFSITVRMLLRTVLRTPFPSDNSILEWPCKPKLSVSSETVDGFKAKI